MTKVIVQEFSLRRWHITLYKHWEKGFLVDGDRWVIKTFLPTGQVFQGGVWTDVVPLYVAPLPAAGVTPVLINTDNPAYTWVKKPPKYHPCLLVKEQARVGIKDFETGETLGHMIVPQEAVAWSGGWEAPENKDVWEKYREQATSFFESLGLSVFNVGIPDKSSLINAIHSADHYYAAAHGGETCVWIGTLGYLRPDDVQSALDSRPPYVFVFLGHCGAMVNTGEGTFAYSFTKGFTSGVVIGYKIITEVDEWFWLYSFDFESKLWEYLLTGETVGDALDDALSDFPEVSPIVAIAGDSGVILAWGILKVDTTPVKGTIIVDGEVVGTAPISTKVGVGSHTVGFGNVSGYLTPALVTVDITLSEVTELTATYQAVAPLIAGLGVILVMTVGLTVGLMGFITKVK